MPMSPEEENSALRGVGILILETIDREWSRVELEFSASHRLSTHTVTVNSPDGKVFYPRLPSEAITILSDLRSGMHRNDTGTWFSLKYTITGDQKYYVDFDYDNEPDFGFEIDPHTYHMDLQKFPRSEENIPDWLQERIRQARED